MIYIESTKTDPYYNLALEQYFFDHSDGTEPIFILWQNYNTIVIGKYQNTIEEINTDYVQKNGINVARRLSGGGAVYHDKGNLNYTFIVKREESFDFNFKHFVLPVIDVLKDLGITAEFTGRNDTTIDGKKFSGNSQYIKQGKVLHHGCIMLDSNLENVSEALKVRQIKLESKSTKSVRSRVTSINQNLENPITMDEFKQRLRSKVLVAGDNINEHFLTEDEEAAIQKLRDEKYATWEWNFGKDPEYFIKKEAKFDCGIVSCHMDVDGGAIRNIKIYGDFFGQGEISELEERLKGVYLTDDIAKILTDFDINRYINGIDPQELADLIKKI